MFLSAKQPVFELVRCSLEVTLYKFANPRISHAVGYVTTTIICCLEIGLSLVDCVYF